MVYKAPVLRALSISQMVLGNCMFVAGVASIFGLDHWTSFVGFGVWIGVWVQITGILGYNGAKDNSVPRKCLIGVFMGFSITSCVLASILVIFYSIAMAEFADRLSCSLSYDGYESDYYDCYYGDSWGMAQIGAGLSSCMLIFGVVEFFVALASSIYCCNAVCCSWSAPQPQTQQVMLVPAQQMHHGGQASMVVMQPSGQVTTMPTNYPAAGQQAMFVSEQPMQQMQQAYWAPGSAPGGVVAVGTTMQTQANAQFKLNQEGPPPYPSAGATVAQTGVQDDTYEVEDESAMLLA